MISFIHAKAPLHQGIVLPVFLEIFITLSLTSLAGLMLGLTLSACAPSTDRAMSFVPLLLVPQVIFSGMLFKLDTPFLQIISSFFAMRWAMAGMGSSVGLHADKLGVDSFAYQGTLFVSLQEKTLIQQQAMQHLFLIWGILVTMIVVLGAMTCLFLMWKEKK